MCERERNNAYSDAAIVVRRGRQVVGQFTRKTVEDT